MTCVWQCLILVGMQQETTITVPESLRFSPFITSKGAVIPQDAAHDDVLDAFIKLKRLKQLVAVLAKQYEEEVVEWCRGNDTRLVVGDNQYYYVGVEKVVKCIDIAGALEKALELTLGDFDAMVKLLSSSPIKHGAYRSMLEETAGEDADFLWSEFFERVEKDKVKEGKSKQTLKKLIEVDKRFSRVANRR